MCVCALCWCCYCAQSVTARIANDVKMFTEPCVQAAFLPSGFPTKTLRAFIFCPIRVTRPARFFILCSIPEWCLVQRTESESRPIVQLTDAALAGNKLHSNSSIQDIFKSSFSPPSGFCHITLLLAIEHKRDFVCRVVSCCVVSCRVVLCCVVSCCVVWMWTWPAAWPTQRNCLRVHSVFVIMTTWNVILRVQMTRIFFKADHVTVTVCVDCGRYGVNVFVSGNKRAACVLSLYFELKHKPAQWRSVRNCNSGACV
jgi:hypothetical protein